VVAAVLVESSSDRHGTVSTLDLPAFVANTDKGFGLTNFIATRRLRKLVSASDHLGKSSFVD
jgi:hypothetical protein